MIGKKCKDGDMKQDKKTIASAMKKATGKEPVKLAAGGVGKLKKGYPMTKGKK